MTLEIVKEKDKRIRKTLLSIFLIIALISSFSFSGNKIVFIFLIITNLILLTFSYDKFNFSKIGLLKVFEDKFLVEIDGEEQKEFYFNNLSLLRIEHNHFYSENYFVRVNNDLKITLVKPDEEFTLKVLVKKKAKLKFKNFLEKLYSSKTIQIKEYNFDGSRSFLFRSNFSYNEIQDIKKKYKLSW